MLAHPDHAGWRPEIWILNALALWMNQHRPNGNPHRPDSYSELLITMFWKEIM